MSGYDIQYSVERFKLKGLKYKPDLVLWFVIKDDLLRLNELFYPKMAKLPESVFNNKNQNLKANEEYYSSLKNIREEVINEIGGEDAVLAIQKQNLRDISRYYNGNLLIFTFHSVPDKYKTFLESFVSSRPKTFFFQQITKTNNKDYFLPDGHPSSKGAKMIAEDLFNYLYENKILKCN
jgi:hypothetical protein